jgi:Phage integrase family
MLAAARDSANPFDFALACLLGLLGLRIFEACGLHLADLGEEHGHRVLRVVGKGHKFLLVPMPPAVARAADRAAADRATGPLLLNRRGARMDRHAATRRLHNLQATAGVRIVRMHPMLRHTLSPTCSTPASTYATPKLPPATPTRAPPCVTAARAPISTATPTKSSPPTCPLAPDRRRREWVDPVRGMSRHREIG